MAMKFGGFTPEQMKVLLPKLGYKGSMQTDEIDMFLAASPRAASQLGRYTEAARQMVEGKPIDKMRNMANGGFVFPSKNAKGNVNRLNLEDNPEYGENIEQQTAAVNKLQNTFPLPQEDTRRFQEGGTVAYRPPQAGVQPPTQAVEDPAQTFLNTTQQNYSNALASQQSARDALAADPSNENLLTALTAADSKVAQLNEAVTQAQDQFKQTSMPTPAELIQQSTVDPLSLVTQGYTQTTDPGQAAAGTIALDSGQAGVTREAATQSGQAVTAAAPTISPASLAETTATAPGVAQATAGTVAAQGQVSSDANVQAAQQTPSQLAQLALTPSQIAQAAQVQAPIARSLQAGETISGSAVDMATVKAETNFAAATGAPSTDATVQGQLTQLMADFEGGDPPAWAAGAMRAATAAMAQRGLGASSMAGQAHTGCYGVCATNCPNRCFYLC